MTEEDADRLHLRLEQMLSEYEQRFVQLGKWAVTGVLDENGKVVVSPHFIAGQRDMLLDVMADIERILGINTGMHG